MADVFISYARTDRHRIAALSAALEAAGFSVWWDRSIAGGVEFSKEIERELTSAKAVIVAWSATGNESPWVRDEAALAKDQKKLIAITLDGQSPPMGFRQFHALNFSSPNEAACTEAFGNLVDSVKQHISAGEQSGVGILEKAANKIDDTQQPSKRAVATALRRIARQNIPWRRIASIVAVLFVAVGFVLWRQTAITPEPDAIVDVIDVREQSVAVLPFKNLSSDPEQVYFSDGVAGEILNALAQVRDLHVTAQSSSFQFREDDRDTQDVARRLGVAAIVDGSVQKFGNQIRVTAQLVDARSNRLVWSQTFDGEQETLFDIQDSVAAEIVSVMQANFDLDASSAAPVGRIDVPLEAYDLYLQAKALLSSLFAAGAPNPRFDLAVPAYDLLTQAIDIAPDFALAYAGRGEATYWIGWIDKSGSALAMTDFESPFPIGEAQARMDADIEHALALGPDLSAVHVSYQFHSSVKWHDMSSVQVLSTHVDEALRINPNNAGARLIRSDIFRRNGQYREHFEEVERAYRLDPLNQEILGAMVLQYFYLGDFENLDPFINQLILWTTDSAALTGSAYAYAEYGRFENLVEFERRGAQIPLDSDGEDYFHGWVGALWGFGASYVTLGIPEMARLRLRDIYDDTFLILEGRYDEAVDYLEAEWAILSDPEKVKKLRQPVWRYRPRGVPANLAFSYLFTGQYDEIVELVSQTRLRPGPKNLPDMMDPDFPWLETSYIYALYQTDAENAEEWTAEHLKLCEDLLAQGVMIPNYEYEYARTLTILGRHDEAFASLERAIDKGWRRWYFEIDPITAPLREMPEFEALKARYDADIARMRKIVVEGLREQGFEIAE